MYKDLFYYLGRVEVDGSPSIVHRDLYCEHSHVLGKSGRGKSSMVLAPFCEQTISFGDTSLIFVDLKADKLENLAACCAAQRELKSRTGMDIPIRVFTLKNGGTSHIFNPFLTRGLNQMSFADRVTLITEPLDLFYGVGYGHGHFSAKNSATVRECLIANPGISSFHELYSALMEQARDPNSYVGSQHRNEYIQVAETVLSLASCSVLNVSPSTLHSKEALANQIDLAAAFQSPAIYYFHLTSVTSPFVAQVVGRLVVKYLLIAAQSALRKVRVQVVIDEFQRMISNNLDVVFQQARSQDIGIMIANQSMGDLRNAGPVLLSAIESNCAVRQWLSVNTADDLEHLTKLFGSYKKVHETVTDSPHGRSVSRTLRDEPRITTNNLQEISDDPFLSVVQIDGERDGFAKYRGVPFVLRSSFHISDEDYKDRLKLQWPTDLPGMIEVSELPIPPTPVGRTKTNFKSKAKHADSANTNANDHLSFDELLG